MTDASAHPDDRAVIPGRSLHAADASSGFSEEDAIDAVAASVRRLFSVVSEQQARDLASLVLADLRAQGIHLVREGGPGSL
jgi:hypothetical protein